MLDLREGDRWLEIRGTAELAEDTGRSLPKALSRKTSARIRRPSPTRWFA